MSRSVGRREGIYPSEVLGPLLNGQAEVIVSLALPVFLKACGCLFWQMWAGVGRSNSLRARCLGLMVTGLGPCDMDQCSLGPCGLGPCGLDQYSLGLCGLGPSSLGP